MSDFAEDELPDDIYDQIKVLSERGNVMLEAGDADGAIAVWHEALGMLPSPQKRWEAWVWLNASLGEAYRDKGDLQRALACFQAAAAGADGHMNPFVLISLGATLYDLGRTDESTDPLLRAFMLEGREIFDEYGGPYLDHLRQKGLID
ncbi:hypothetical protein LQ948_18755 [Jiella sp. MQZ9-1]|uniref:Tetratricopeptide repeat protein n=1 Tax=Jiella flava TaxID=2816857 RepID=A0A939G3V5_9HYPH|nr:hypothetical protein [Jiella flava]MBO0664589.1 hypothetical protein [Jiella flava]MCD2473229.1 hypothetical protein [Jiella flava]